MGTGRRRYCGLAVQYGGYPFGSWGAHMFFEWAAQVGSVVVEFGELVTCTVEAARWAVALEGGVTSFIGALECVFARDVTGASTDSAPFVFGRFCAVLSVVVEQETLITLSVWLGDGGRSNGDRRAKHGETPGTVYLLDLFPCGVNEDKRAVRLFKARIGERLTRPVRAVNDAAPLDRGIITELSK